MTEAERAEDELSLRCDQIQTAEAREDALLARVTELEDALALVLPYTTRNPSLCDCPFEDLPPHRPHCYAGQFGQAMSEIARVMAKRDETDEPREGRED